MADTILKIICHIEINKKNEKDMVNNVNVFTVGAKRKQKS